MLRVLITHNLARSILAICGFFTYMFLFALYSNWMSAEEVLGKVFLATEDKPDGNWPMTSKLFVGTKAYLLWLVGLHLTSYFVQVYRFIKWLPFEQEA